MCQGKAQVGSPAPDFSATAIVDGRLKRVSLSNYTEANHWLILIFFPKAWSFICPTEIKAFSARLEEFLYNRSCAVVFASTDSEHSLKAWNATSDMEGGLGGVHVPIISDCSHRISRDYGVLIEDEGTAQRALFIIDPKGTVRGMTVNDAAVGRSVDETLRILDALAFKDEFGEGCPADWKKGDKGIDITARARIEGTVDLSRKSWSEWARPKLQRAWSGTSQRSIASGLYSSSRLRSDSNNSLTPPAFGNAYQTSLSSGQQSPLASPTSDGNAMEVAMQQRLENARAAIQNQAQSQGTGVAN